MTKRASFIVKAGILHSNYYNYDKVIYSTTKTKVTITCPTHGDFDQRPDNHLQGQGCPECGRTKTVASRKLSYEDFVSRAHEVHGTTYTYTDTSYMSTKDKTIVTCPLHGDFEQVPTKHLSGQGCPTCSSIQGGTKCRIKYSEAVRRFTAVHGDTYTYSPESYNGISENITITCPVHGDFQQRGTHHAAGSGCPSCANYGFDGTLPGILYILSINDGEFYKVGITNRTIQERFTVLDLSKLEVLYVEKFCDGYKARDRETEIKQKYKEFRPQDVYVLSSGNSEIFTINIYEKEFLHEPKH